MRNVWIWFLGLFLFKYKSFLGHSVFSYEKPFHSISLFSTFFKYKIVVFSLISQRKLTFSYCMFKHVPEDEEDGKTPTQSLLKKGRHFSPFCLKSFFHIDNFDFPFTLLFVYAHVCVPERENINCTMLICFFILELEYGWFIFND